MESLPNTCRSVPSIASQARTLHHAASSASLGSTRLATKSTASFGLQACAVTPAWPRWGHSDSSCSSSAKAFAAPSCELGGTMRKISSAERTRQAVGWSLHCDPTCVKSSGGESHHRVFGAPATETQSSAILCSAEVSCTAFHTLGISSAELPLKDCRDLQSSWQWA